MDEHVGRGRQGERETRAAVGDARDAGRGRGIRRAAFDEQLGDGRSGDRPRRGSGRSGCERCRGGGVSSSAQRMSTAPAGGSSSVLSRAFWASGLSRWAEAMMATRTRPSSGSSDSSTISDRAWSMRICPPAPDGARRCTSGWLSCSTLRQAAQARQGRSPGSSARQSRPAARSSASVVLPARAGPARGWCWAAAARRPPGRRWRGRPAGRASGSRPPSVRPPSWRPCGSRSGASAWPRPRREPWRHPRPRPRGPPSWAALRVEVRRFGLASASGSAPKALVASAAGASVVAALRVEVRRFGLASALGLGPEGARGVGRGGLRRGGLAGRGPALRLGLGLGGRRRLGTGRARRATLAGELGAEHLLELGRDLAPRVATGRSRRLAGRRPLGARAPVGTRAASVSRTSVRPRAAIGARATIGARTAAAVCAAAAAAGAAVSLAIDGGLVGATAAATTTPGSRAPARPAGALAPLGEQVLGDLRLVLVLLLDDTAEAGADVGSRRHADLAVPDGAEGGRLRRARGRVRLEVLVLVFLVARAGGRLGRTGDAGRLAILAATATATATATPASAAAWTVALALALGTGRQPGLELAAALGGLLALLRLLGLEGGAGVLELLDLGPLVGGRRSGDLGELLSRQHDEVGAGGRRPASARGRGRTNRLGSLLALGGATASAAAAAAPRCALGLLVGHLGHRQVVLGRHAAAAPRRALLDLRDLGDVDERVGDLDEVGAGVAAEADDLDADAHLLHGPDGRREVAVTGDDDGDVQVLGGAHHVHDQLDVEVGLDLPVAVLADVLADDLVAAAGQEGVELALVLVVRVEARVGVRAHEVPAGGGRLQQRRVVDVHAGRLGRVEDVRDVDEDGDILAQGKSLPMFEPHHGARSRSSMRRTAPVRSSTLTGRLDRGCGASLRSPGRRPVGGARP